MGEETPNRPQIRGECASGPRPCPWVGCRHHLVEIRVRARGAVDVAGDVLEPHATVEELDAAAERLADRLRLMPATCALDVAEQQGLNRTDVGLVLGLTRTRVQQIEQQGSDRLRRGDRSRMLR